MNIIHTYTPSPNSASSFPQQNLPIMTIIFTKERGTALKFFFYNVYILHIIERELFREFFFPTAFHAATGGGGQAGQKGRWRALSSAFLCIFCSAPQDSLRFVLPKKLLPARAVYIPCFSSPAWLPEGGTYSAVPLWVCKKQK